MSQNPHRARTLNWWHISDLHFSGSADPYDRNVVLRALVQALDGFANRARRPDLIFVTGDVGNYGKPDDYPAVSRFFDDLRTVVGLDRRHLFVVPGNHDVNRNAGSGLSRTLENEDDSVRFFGPDDPQHHFAKFQAFRLWHDDYFRGIRSLAARSTCQAEVIDVRGLRVGVLSVNSALFARGDDDHAKLWIGRRPLDDATSVLRSQNPAISVALVHHPLDWLHDEERANIRTTLRSQMDCILRGHLHDNEIEEVMSEAGECLEMAAGAAYQTRRWPNRCLFVEVDFDRARVKVFPIRYEDRPREVWTVDPSVFPSEPTHEGTHTVQWKSDAVARQDGDLPRSAPVRDGDDISPAEHHDAQPGGARASIRSPAIAPSVLRYRAPGTLWVGGIEFVHIQGGEFLMGASDDDRKAFLWERHTHPVRVPSFWIARTPTTRGQFARFIEESSYREPPYWRGVNENDRDHPMLCERLEDIEAFCKWLTIYAVKDAPRLSLAGVQLTSEAEWEFAARGRGDKGQEGRRYPWGSETPDSTRANYASTETASVFAHPDGATPDGVLDMAGNVFERCRDRIALSMWSYKWEGGVVEDPVGRMGTQMALRGCDYRMPAECLRATWRVGNLPDLWLFTSKLPFLGERFGLHIFRYLSQHLALSAWTTTAKVGFRCTFRVEE